MKKLVSALVAIATAALGVGTASPSVAYDDPPEFVGTCYMTLPKKIYLHANKAVTVRASVKSCPWQARTGYFGWDWENGRTNSWSMGYTYDGDRMNPQAGMSGKLYSWEYGTHWVEPSESSTFSPDYDYEYQFWLGSSPSYTTAKLRSNIDMKIRGKGKKRVLTATAKRHTPHSGIKKATGKITIYRNGKAWKNLKLKKGKSSIRLPGKKKARWHAGIKGTSQNWGETTYSMKR